MKIYLCINVLLITSYLLFILVRKLSFKLRFHFDHRAWIKLGQVLILSSIVMPICFQLLPQKEVPLAQWGAFVTVSDQMVKKTLLRDSQIQTRSAIQVVKKVDGFQRFSVWVKNRLSLENILMLFFATGLGFSCFRFGFNLFRLVQVTRRSLVLHSIGKVRVALTDVTDIPFSVRLFSLSWVMLPYSLIENKNDFKLALKHEIQHHRQGDTLWSVFVEVLLCGFFPNTALYLWKRDIIELQEFSCDEALIGQKGISSRDYGSCLIRVAETALKSRQMYVGTTCMAAISKNPNYHKSFLKRRIEMFTSQDRPRMYRSVGLVIGIVMAALTMALAYGAEQSLRVTDQDKMNPGIVKVDPVIQAIADQALADAVKKQNAKGGIAIVADPMTGKILAVANIDPTKGKKKFWALSQTLEPASMIKPIVAAQAIENGTTTAQEKHNCENGSYKYGDEVYHDWKDSGWPELTTEETIGVSSNICAMKIGEKVGADGLRKMLVDFGFGPGGSSKTFPAAKAGVLPPPEDVKHPKIVPYVSAGFGFQTTPLELLQAYGAIANGGKLMKPISADAKDSSQQIVRRVLSEDSARKMKEVLRQVVLKGTGQPAISTIYSTAGKTATAYIPDQKEWALVQGKKHGNFAGFVGFAPVKNPRVEVYVGIFDPNTNTGGAHGGEHAAPVFKVIAENVLKHMKVAPDRNQL